MLSFIASASCLRVRRSSSVRRQQLALLVVCVTAQLSPMTGSPLCAAADPNTNVQFDLCSTHGDSAVSLLAIAHNLEVRMFTELDVAPAAPAESSVPAAVYLQKNTTGANVSATAAVSGDNSTKSNVTNPNGSGEHWALAAQSEIVNAKKESSPCNVSIEPAPYSEMPDPVVMVDPINGSSPPSNHTPSKDCVVSDWQDWGACADVQNAITMSRMEARSRFIINPQQKGGQACLPLSQSRACSAAGVIHKIR